MIGDGGFWALTRHSDVSTAVTCGPGWSVEARSAFVRRLDEADPTGALTTNLLLCMDPPLIHPGAAGGQSVLHAGACPGVGLEDELRERAHRIVWAAKKNEEHG